MLTSYGKSRNSALANALDSPRRGGPSGIGKGAPKRKERAVSDDERVPAEVEGGGTPERRPAPGHPDGTPPAVVVAKVVERGIRAEAVRTRSAAAKAISEANLVSSASRILGVHLAPNGSQKEQVAAMRRKTEAWADRIRSGHIQQRDAWHYLQSTIKRTLLYPLLATTLSEDDCTRVEAPALEAGLQASGMPSNMPRDVVFGPERYLGLGHGSLYHTQGAKHIQAILDFGKTDTVTGHQIRALIEGHKLELGLQGSLFDHDWSRFGKCATDTWITDTWSYTWKEKLRIDEETPSLLPQREGDLFLMEEFAKAGFSSSKLDRLNRCRRHLQAITLSDITSGDGSKVTSEALRGIKNDHLPGDLIWPLQPSPSYRLWKEWSEALTEVFRLDKYGLLPTARRLGRWLMTCRTPTAIHVPSEDRIYVNEEGGWRAWRRVPGRRGRASSWKFISTEEVLEARPDGRPAVNYRIEGRQLLLSGSAEMVKEERDISSFPLRFIDRCRAATEGSRWALENTWSDDDGAYVAESIKIGKAMAVSDGSFKDETGSAAFVLEGRKWNHLRITGDCMVPGHPEDQSAYRSELCGLLGIMMTLRCLCQQYHISGGAITIACDGLSAIRKALDADSTFSSRSSQFDLLSAIESIALELPISIRWRHVDGHQDDGRIGPLDRWEALNCEMDQAAKDRWQRSFPTHRPFYKVDGALWNFYVDTARTGPAGARRSVGGTFVGNDLPDRLADFVLGGKLLSYWQSKCWRNPQTDSSAICRAHWSSVAKAAASAARSSKVFVAKFASGHISTGERLHKRGYIESPTCTRCGSKEETPQHVLACPHGNPRWEELQQVLLEWGRKADGAQGLVPAIVAGLDAWRKNPSDPAIALPRAAHYPSLVKAVRAQSELGWGLGWIGVLAPEWEQTQRIHFRAKRSRRSSERWISELIKKLRNVSWDMWAFRTYQVKSERDVEAERLVCALNRRITTLCDQGPSFLPRPCRSLLSGPVYKILRRPVEARLAWLDKVQSAREWQLQSACPPSLRNYYHLKFFQGGLLARLRSSKQPPALRTTAIAPRKQLLTLDHDDE